MSVALFVGIVVVVAALLLLVAVQNVFHFVILAIANLEMSAVIRIFVEVQLVVSVVVVTAVDGPAMQAIRVPMNERNEKWKILTQLPGVRT